MKISFAAGVLALALTASSVAFAEPVKIGMITTLSGGGAVIGEEIKNGAELALQHLGNKVGALPA